MKGFFLTLAILLSVSLTHAIEPQDSLLIATAKWHTITKFGGITHKRAHIEGLYGSTQSINLVEIPRSRKSEFGISGNNGMRKTSQQAAEQNAVAAINGTYYDMKVGNSACFYKIDGEVIDSTLRSEFQGRVNGAIKITKGKLQIIKWSPEIESTHNGRRGTILASGPILIRDGKMEEWSQFSESFILTRHPRSVIFTKKDNTVVMLTIDGRSRGNADGMSIPELAELAKALGAENAINLDGGGSTTLWMKDGGILNYPCDNRRYDHEGERSVSNIIYVK